MVDTNAVNFFIDKAGCTNEEAERWAAAEIKATELGYTFIWESDWSLGSHKEFFGALSIFGESGEPDTCEVCKIVSPTGLVMGTLGCVDDADADVRRAIEAELAEEVLFD